MHLFRMPEKVKTEETKPIEASVLGCGIVQLGGVYLSTVEEIKAACQKARWMHEAALVIASTGGNEYGISGETTSARLEGAGFKVLAEAVNQRHEYRDGHKVKLWVCDVTDWPKPETESLETVVFAPRAEDAPIVEPPWRVERA